MKLVSLDRDGAINVARKYPALSPAGRDIGRFLP
jgi:hypothetical protein